MPRGACCVWGDACEATFEKFEALVSLYFIFVELFELTATLFILDYLVPFQPL